MGLLDKCENRSKLLSYRKASCCPICFDIALLLIERGVSSASSIAIDSAYCSLKLFSSADQVWIEAFATFDVKVKPVSALYLTSHYYYHYV